MKKIILSEKGATKYVAFCRSIFLRRIFVQFKKKKLLGSNYTIELDIRYILIRNSVGNLQSFCRAWNLVAKNLYNINYFCTIRK
ncbi:hypothetical protein BpHYR1_041370 [Brachionus plicatilis]|uniref:Uncharacterized protein n=1 Tax=Brachionus plicatilis TaxID=10195 RepID=A0A3M7SLB8_BRAPC|nr:hypothetical protein BpHYR1_041370 [Brachionus plicatilis]